MSHWDFSRRPETEQDAPPPRPAGTSCEPDLVLGTDDAWDDDGTAPYPITYERDDSLAAAPEPAPPPAAPWGPWPAADSGPPGETPAGWDGADGDWDEEGRRPAGRGVRRWLVLAGVAVAGAAVGAAAVLLAGRSGQAAGAPAAPPATPAAQHSAALSAPLTPAHAQAVAARYTTVNSSANG